MKLPVSRWPEAWPRRLLLAACFPASPAWAGESGLEAAGVAGWVLAAIAIGVGFWRTRGLAQHLMIVRRDRETGDRRWRQLLAETTGLRKVAQQLSTIAPALQTAADIRRAALGEVRRELEGAAQRLEEMANALRAPPAGAPGAPSERSAQLSDLEPRLQALDEGAHGIGEKFTRLHDRTDEIARAVEGLDKVSERINLLSLNAAIESEKAGDRGHGFVAIAQEIRRLADQTAASSLGIGRHVAKTREVVSEGIMSVEHFQAEALGGVSSLRQALGSRPALPASPEAGSSEQVSQLAQTCNTLADNLRSGARTLATEDERTLERLRNLTQLAGQLQAALDALPTDSGNSTA